MKNLLSGLAFGLLAGSAYGDVLNCGGTEPFWDMSISGENITLTEAGSDPVVYPSVPEKSAYGYTADYIRVYNTVNEHGETPVPVTIMVLKGTCSDGMSERSYDYQVVFQEGEKVLGGCCSYK